MYIYDIECYPNFFSVIFVNANTKQELINKYIEADIDKDEKVKQDTLRKIDYKLFVIYTDDSINDISGLVNFVKRTKVLVGYNNNKYDDILIDYIVSQYVNLLPLGDSINNMLNNISQDIISYLGADSFRRNFAPLKGYFHKYKSIDLMKLYYLDYKRISLKQVGIALKYHRIQDLPYKFNINITKNMVNKILDYNLNDVLITLALYNYKNRAEIKLRLKVMSEYGINVLSSSRSAMGDRQMSYLWGSC